MTNNTVPAASVTTQVTPVTDEEFEAGPPGELWLAVDPLDRHPEGGLT